MGINLTNPNFKPEYDSHAASLTAHMDNPFRLMRTGEYMGGDSGAFTLVANTLYCAWWFTPRAVTVDRVAVHVSTAASGKSVRVGIYNADGTNLYPGTLKTDIGTASTTSTGVKAITPAADISLAAGLWGFAVVSDGTPALRAVDPFGYTAPMGMTATDFQYQQRVWNVAFTYAALPDPFTAAGTLITDNNAAKLLAVPRIKSLD